MVYEGGKSAARLVNPIAKFVLVFESLEYYDWNIGEGLEYRNANYIFTNKYRIG